MKRTIPSTQALLCFASAARHGSYTRAAQELGLTQSAISRQILTLEETLGVQLFRRTRHGMEISTAGKAYARQITRRLQGLEQDTLNIMANKMGTGHITLAAMPTFATHWLIPRLPQLMQDFPQLTIHLENQTHPFIFSNTEFDAALYCGTSAQVQNWPGIEATPLVAEEIFPICSPSFRPAGLPLSPSAIARLPLLQQTTRPFIWRQWFDAMGVDTPNALDGSRFELFSMLARAASHGMGIALIPPMLVQPELVRGSLVIACPHAIPHNDRSYYLITPQNHGNTLLDHFTAWLRKQASSPSNDSQQLPQPSA